jgi:sterol desaturase/sphingolipid hydroxylase (fatty acid hydroxylase superfamily)
MVSLSLQNTVVIAVVVLIGLEILRIIVPVVFTWLNFPLIPVKGKHLDEFETLDNAFILCNKILTVMFVYHFILVTMSTESIKWHSSEVTLSNTFGSLVMFYLFYDFWYMWFHRFLHLRSVYPWIHKHHHRQKAPSRGNPDAINVHPFEFLVGEYLHLLTIYLIPCHIYAAGLFILIGGVLASLNHTRFDVNIPYLYNVNVHDVHHRVPESNYAQYIMIWDKLFGSYRPYEFAEKRSKE